MIVPVLSEFNDYCQSVRDKLHSQHIYADVDLSKEQFKKKVRSAQVSQYNYQLIVGRGEVDNSTVNIRTRENKVEGEMKVDDFIDMINKNCKEFK